MTTFELGTKVPLLVRAPFVAGAVAGLRRHELAEAVDLFPTMVSLAGLPPVPSCEALAGTDLSQLLVAGDPAAAVENKSYAFSQFAKKYVWSKETQQREAWNTCGGVNRSAIDLFGYSVRAASGWRYTEWRAWNGTAQRAEWGPPPVARELYAQPDSCGGDFDCQSPAANDWNTSTAHRAIADELAAVVRAQFKS